MQKVIDVSTIQGVMFDLDDTLVRSVLDFDLLRQLLGFPKGVPVLEHMALISDPNDAAKASQIVAEYELECAQSASWMPGAKALLEQLNKQQIPTAILTRNVKTATEYMIKTLGIPIDLVLTREDCKPKPDPEGLLQIAKQWGLDVSGLVYIGDYVFDLDAARNANVIACLYRNQKNAQFSEKADWVIDHYDELTEQFRAQGRAELAACASVHSDNTTCKSS